MEQERKKPATWVNGGGRNDKHWHRSGEQMAAWERKFEDIEQEAREIKASPYARCSKRLAQLAKEKRHWQRMLDANGVAHSIRGKGHNVRQ